MSSEGYPLHIREFSWPGRDPDGRPTRGLVRAHIELPRADAAPVILDIEAMAGPRRVVGAGSIPRGEPISLWQGDRLWSGQIVAASFWLGGPPEPQTLVNPASGERFPDPKWDAADPSTWAPPDFWLSWPDHCPAHCRAPHFSNPGWLLADDVPGRSARRAVRVLLRLTRPGGRPLGSGYTTIDDLRRGMRGLIREQIQPTATNLATELGIDAGTVTNVAKREGFSDATAFIREFIRDSSDR